MSETRPTRSDPKGGRRWGRLRHPKPAVAEDSRLQKLAADVGFS